MPAMLTVLTILFFNLSVTFAEETDRTLFRFNSPQAVSDWRTVNDGVMGGRSQGRFKVNRFKNLEFYGNLSLANNGGFASVRSGRARLDLKQGDSILLRLRGDGRTYNFNLYATGRSGETTFRKSFPTVAGKWTDVRLPLDQFVATYRGRQLANRQLDPASISRLGIQLGDKKAGPFKLEVESIKVAGPQPRP